jgi:hypothetical protein
MGACGCLHVDEHPGCTPLEHTGSPPAKTQVTAHTLPKSFEPAEKAYTKSFFHRKNLQLAKSCCTFADGEQ